MKTRIAVMLWALAGLSPALPAAAAEPAPVAHVAIAAAYPESEAVAAWRGLASSYIRKALNEQTLNRDPVLNVRVDRVMATVGTAVGAIDPRFANVSWKVILIERFGYGAVAFPGETVIVDADFLRKMKLSDEELALILAHEAAHVIAGHASVKLSFMAAYLGKERLPTARKALVEFLAEDAYAVAFRPTARLQEREADTLGAAIFFATGYDPQRALWLFDKLALTATNEDGDRDSHDSAGIRKKTVSGVLADLQKIESGHAVAQR